MKSEQQQKPCNPIGKDHSPETQKLKFNAPDNAEYVFFFFFLCVYSSASNFKVNSPILPEFKRVRGCMPVQVICKFNKGPIKTKHAMLRIRSNMTLLGIWWQVRLKTRSD